MPSGFTPSRFHAVHTAPAWMPPYERTLLYGLVVGLAPERILEIGTFQGGSTLIMCAALDDHGSGRIVCVDPNPRLAPETLAAIEHRTTILAEPSPDGVAKAREVANAPFDFALIDGDHDLEPVVADIEATLPVLADEAHLLFHDAHHWQVRDGIDRVLHRDPRLSDAGLVSRIATDGEGGPWGGLRLLHFDRNAATS